MKVIITKHEIYGEVHHPDSSASSAFGDKEERRGIIDGVTIITTKSMSDDEIVVHKKERLKNLKVIQEKADVETYGKRSHFIGRGRPMQPTMRRQHR